MCVCMSYSHTSLTWFDTCSVLSHDVLVSVATDKEGLSNGDRGNRETPGFLFFCEQRIILW